MNLTSLPFIGQLYLPFLLTSLIIGMLILILLEQRKTGEKDTNTQTHPLTNTTSNTTSNTTKTTPRTESREERKEDKELETIERRNKQNSAVKERGTEDIKPSTHSSSASSSSSTSGSEEEEAGRSQGSSPRRGVQRVKRKKHACKGSAIVCATKKKVTEVTILTDSQEEDVKVSLGDLAAEIRSEGVACSVHPATTTLLPALSTHEPSHLLLLFGTTSEGCQHLKEALTMTLGGGGGDSGGGVSASPPQPFLYSVTCWCASASGDVFESAQALSSTLAGCGGAEWLPIACIAPSGHTKGPAERPVMLREEYVKTVMDKITKPGKKCCGTSCGSKTVDIEDLAASLLPRAAVTS